MAENRRGRPVDGDEQQVLNNRSTCPVCGVDSMYLFNPDLYFHMDGSANDVCWLAAQRGKAEHRYERPTYIHRVFNV